MTCNKVCKMNGCHKLVTECDEQFCAEHLLERLQNDNGFKDILKQPEEG